MTELAQLIARFERACEECKTPDQAAALIVELNCVAGLSGRSDPAVPMIQGAVVPAKLWAEYGPRFERLRDRITAKRLAFLREIQRELEARWMATLRLFFPASFRELDSEEPLEDAALLRQCDGLSDKTFLEQRARFDGTPGLSLPIRATLVFDPAKNALEVVLEIALAQRASEGEIATISSRINATLYSGWGTNPGFSFPEALSDFVFHFETTPSHHEVVPKNR